MSQNSDADHQYFLPNLSQLGNITSIPYPSLKVPTRTYLLGDEAVREEIREALGNPSGELLQRLGQVLQNSKTSYQSTHPQTASDRRSVPSPLFLALNKEYPNLAINSDRKPPTCEVRVLISPIKQHKKLEQKPLPKLQSTDNTIEITETNAGKRGKKVKHAQYIIQEPLDPLIKIDAFISTLSDWKEREHSEPLGILLLNELSSEVVKLRQQNLLHTIPEGDIQALVSAMHLQIQQSSKSSLKFVDENSNNIKSEDYTLVMVGLESVLVMLSTIIAENIPKSCWSEEVLEDALKLCKSQLRNYIFPFYDSNCRTNSDHSDEIEEMKVEIKSKSKKKSTKHIEHPSTMLFKLVEILDQLNLLVVKERLPDSILLDINNISLPTLFVEGIHTMQLSALNVIRSVFSRYPKHRQLILDDLFSDLTKLPTNKRNMRNYKLVQQKKSIQVVTALVLQLIQCCTDLPRNHMEGNDDESRNSYEGAIGVAHNFIQSFLNNCSHKKYENDYRPILQNLVEDLLVTLNMPEWPASEILLSIICRNLAKIVMSEEKDMNESLKFLSIQLIGVIAARVRQDHLNLKESKIFNIPEARLVNAEGITGTEVIDCVCNDTNEIVNGEQIPMLDCDRCHRWFHFGCVGVDQSNAPNVWFCDQCRILKQINQSSAENFLSAPNQIEKDDLTLDVNMDIDVNVHDFGDELDNLQIPDENPVVDQKYQQSVIKQLILNYLSERLASDSTALFAKQFLLSRWCYEDGENISNHSYYQSQWDTKSFNADATPTLSCDGTYQLIIHLVSKRPLMKSFDLLLSCILHILGENQTKNRTKAIKALTLIVEADPSMLGASRVQNAVKARLWDTSISVREATVDLIGKYILFRPEFTEQYYEVIAERMMDKGLSVRKRVITISQKICQQPDNPIVPKILLAMAPRIHDEEQSIKDLVLKTFEGLWFKKLHFVGPTKAKQEMESLKKRVELMQETLSSMDEKTNEQWFIDLLDLITKQEETAGKISEFQDTCTKICDLLVEKLLSIPPTNAEINPVTKTETNASVQYLMTLNLICQVCPKAALKHVETLEPYLKSQDSDASSAKIFQYVASIMERTVPLIDFPAADFINSLSKDLSNLLNRSGMPVIQSCAKCLCNIVKSVGKNSQVIEILFNHFYSINEKFKNKVEKPTNLANQLTIIRSLFVLGNFCKYYTFDQRDATKNVLSVDALKKIRYGNHVENTYKLFTEFWKNEDLSVRIVALRGMGLLFAAYPGISTRSADIIKSSLAGTTHPRIKNQILATLEEFLIDEEERMNKASKNRASKITKHEGEDDEENINADSGVAGNIIQQNLPDILSRLFDPEFAIRQAALTLVAHILKRALVHPIASVGHLVALQGDHIRIQADRAYKALVTVYETDNKLVLSRLSEGFILSYKFQAEVFGVVKSVVESNWKGLISHECIFNRLYSLCKPNKASRQDFLLTLIRIFEKEAENMLMLKYFTRIITGLVYSHQEEVLYLISQINRRISYSAASLLSSLQSHFKKENKSANTVPTHESIKSIPGLVFLLRAKKFLKSFYSLSAQKCQTYESSDLKLNPLTNKVQIENIDILQHLSLDDPAFSTKWWENLDQFNEVYALFKQEMKNDEDDINVSTIATKPKRVAAPRKKKAEKNDDEPPQKKQKTQRKPAAKKKKAKKGSDDESEGDFTESDDEYQC